MKVEINGVIYPTLVHALLYNPEFDEEDFKKYPEMFVIYKKIKSRYFNKQYEAYSESIVSQKACELDLVTPGLITSRLEYNQVPPVHFFINHGGLTRVN